PRAVRDEHPPGAHASLRRLPGRTLLNGSRAGSARPGIRYLRRRCGGQRSTGTPDAALQHGPPPHGAIVGLEMDFAPLRYVVPTALLRHRTSPMQNCDLVVPSLHGAISDENDLPAGGRPAVVEPGVR